MWIYLHLLALWLTEFQSKRFSNYLLKNNLVHVERRTRKYTWIKKESRNKQQKTPCGSVENIYVSLWINGSSGLFIKKRKVSRYRHASVLCFCLLLLLLLWCSCQFFYSCAASVGFAGVRCALPMRHRHLSSKRATYPSDAPPDRLTILLNEMDTKSRLSASQKRIFKSISSPFVSFTF